MLSFATTRLWHEWKLRQLAYRDYAHRESARPYMRQRGFIINPYRYGGAPPTDPDFPSVVSLLHFEGVDETPTFTDQTGKTWSQVSGGSAVILNDVFKWGATSLVTDAVTFGISTPDHADWDFGSGAFAVEMWIWQVTSSSFPILFNKKDATNHSPVQLLFGNNDGSLLFRASADGSTYGASIASAASAVSVLTWYHIAFTRSGNTFRALLDGVTFGTATMSGALTTNTDVVTLGSVSNGTLPFIGYIDDFRATKGVARYTADFLPPTAAFPDS